MSSEFTMWWAGKQALVWALPIWVLANAIFAVFQTEKIQRAGDWVGQRFVYHEPVLAFSRLALQSENNRLFRFRFKDAEAGCLISYEIQIDGPLSHISYVVMAHPNQWPEFKSHNEYNYGKGKLVTNRKREMYLRYFLAEWSVPLQIRIYVTGLEVDYRAL